MKLSVASSFSSSLFVLAAASVVEAAIAPKVFIVDFYDDEQNIWHGIPEFDLTAHTIAIPGLSMKFPYVYCTKDYSICQMVTGEGEINAAVSSTALVLSSKFDLSKTYWLLAGDAGISPKVGTLGAVTFSQFAIQVALQYEVDAREKPADFSTGYIPQGATQLNVYPEYVYGTEVFQLNDALRQKAIAFAKTATLKDSTDAQTYRNTYSSEPTYAPALLTPSIIACDSASSDVWWSGKILGETFENTTKLFTNNQGSYCTTQQEDNAVLEALLRGHIAKRVDFSRIIEMRTASDFDRQAPGQSATDNLFNGQDAGYDIAVENIYLAGVKVVQGIVSGWKDTFAKGVAPGSYIGDVYGSIGGNPSFGPGSIFNGVGVTLVATSSDSAASSTSTALRRRYAGNRAL